MGFAIGAPHGGADFHRDSREPVFSGHGVPPSSAPAIVQRERGPAKSNAMRERGRSDRRREAARGVGFKKANKGPLSPFFHYDTYSVSPIIPKPAPPIDRATMP